MVAGADHVACFSAENLLFPSTMFRSTEQFAHKSDGAIKNPVERMCAAVIINPTVNCLRICAG
jgi:hypothetical protein